MKKNSLCDRLENINGHWVVWGLGCLVLGIIYLLAAAGIESEIIDPQVFLTYLLNRQIIFGALNALLLGSMSLIIAVLLGLAVALARISQNIILNLLARGYIYFFRSIPMLIQILFWFNAFPIMFPEFSFLLPFSEGSFHLRTIDIITPFWAALIGISLAESAYMAEIIRGGISAIDQGQTDAAKALGMRKRHTVRHIIVPQVFRIILPSMGNEYINLLKGTSLAMTIGYLEILRVATNIYSATFEVVELLSVAAFWYLMLATFVSFFQHLLERKFSTNV